jgi:hypothetical protein
MVSQVLCKYLFIDNSPFSYILGLSYILKIHALVELPLLDLSSIAH